MYSLAQYFEESNLEQTAPDGELKGYSPKIGVQIKDVYIIVCNNEYFKVGISYNPDTRFDAIRRHNPYPVELVEVYRRVPMARLVEHYIHISFLECHHHHEWFMYNPSVRVRIDKIVYQLMERLNIVKKLYVLSEEELEKTFPPNFCNTFLQKRQDIFHEKQQKILQEIDSIKNRQFQEIKEGK